MRTILFRSAACLLLSGIVLQSSNTAAQDKSRAKTIIITRGDTVINGKNFNTLTQKEKAEALKDFPSLKNDRLTIEDGMGIIIEGNKLSGRGPRIITRGHGTDGSIIFGDGDSLLTKHFRFNGKNGPEAFIRRFNRDSLFMGSGMDSLFDRFIARIPEFRNNSRFNSRIFGGDANLFDSGGNNSQSFSYTNVDKNGITNRMGFNVSDLPDDDFGKVTGRIKDDKNELELTDLVLLPNFSTGKVMLSFSLPLKTSADISLLNSDMKPLSTDKLQNINGTFSKSLDLPKNGVYYLSVKQGGKWAARKIVKQN